MNVHWSLDVRDFGNISQATIDLAPFMCFVGDNNSGKSFLMSLLWGIITMGKDIFPQRPSDSKSYKVCEDWLRENIHKDAVLDKNVQGMYLSWFNELLSANKDALLRRIFSYKVEIGGVRIINLQRPQLALKLGDDRSRYSVNNDSITFPGKNDSNTEFNREELLRMNCYICWNLIMYGIAAPLYTPVIKGRRNCEPIYLPASRTGFMLTFKNLISDTVRSSFSLYGGMEEENTSYLTMPYIDFLQLITQFETVKQIPKKLNEIVTFIESNMTKGKMSTHKATLPQIMYTPESLKMELPLHVASSVVTEVAPLLLLLKSNIKFKSIIIEEPEAHLHPALQQQMARVLIKLVNNQYPVWITTHSDTIVQHINNMIKLCKKNGPERDGLLKTYGYSKDDLLSPVDVKMFQFDRDKVTSKSHISELKSTQYGFVVPTFNDTLTKLVDEVRAFQKDEDD